MFAGKHFSVTEKKINKASTRKHDIVEVHSAHIRAPAAEETCWMWAKAGE